MNGQRTDGGTLDRWMGPQEDGETHRWMVVPMEGLMDPQMDGRTHGRTDGPTDE